MQPGKYASINAFSGRDVEDKTRTAAGSPGGGRAGQGWGRKASLLSGESSPVASGGLAGLLPQQGGDYEQAFCQLGLPPVWIGRFTHPLIRLAALLRHMWSFRPHIIQATHFYANLYCAVAAWCSGAISIGAARSDVITEVRLNGLWGRWLLSLPSVMLVNSASAKQNALKAGLAGSKVFILPNVVDLASFDHKFERQTLSPDAPNELIALAVARLIPVKRLDLFLRALSLARNSEPELSGVIAGDGPERENLQHLADELGLSGEDVNFLGLRDDIPNILNRADLLVLTSDREGFPNVLIEAMAAGLPVITTPAGEAATIVQDRETGFVVPFDDAVILADRMIELRDEPICANASARMVAAVLSSCTALIHWQDDWLGCTVKSYPA